MKMSEEWAPPVEEPLHGVKRSAGAPVSIALAIPHTPWVPERVESIGRLLTALDHTSHEDVCVDVHCFSDRESNRVWSQKLFRWALDTCASHLLQLQDDAIVAPQFWPVLHAMIEAQPGRIIGLEATHPLVPVQHRAGRRWYRDHWLIGVGYVFPRPLLAQFVAWCRDNPERVANTNEDSLISEWSRESKIDIWHPIPTIIDHDIGVPSTYGNDGHHEWSMYRRPLVTWREVDTPALATPDYWRCTEDGAPKLPGPGTQGCWFCGTEEGKITSQVTGARIGPQCIAQILGVLVGRM